MIPIAKACLSGQLVRRLLDPNIAAQHRIVTKNGEPAHMKYGWVALTIRERVTDCCRLPSPYPRAAQELQRTVEWTLRHEATLAGDVALVRSAD
jgi:hypothetical protein